jgi:Protein of unknown function (DUF2889)
MPFHAEGDPLHTRLFSLDVRSAERGRLAVRGEVLDLRKRGLVPVPGALQLPGVIHRMELEVLVDSAERRVERLEARQPVVAFEASEATGGESCRDPAGALQVLVGAPLGRGFLRRLSEAYGGPRGCTHLLTLARLLASGAARALDLEAERAGAPREAGERVFRRVVAIDGFEGEQRSMQLAVQLSDVHLRPRAPAPAVPLGALASHLELRLLARLELATTLLRELRAEERTRTPDDLEAAFADRSPELEALVGRPLMAGFGAEAVRRFEDEPRSAPLLDALLNLAPGYVQCVAAVRDLFLPGGPGAANLGARPDSCFMWRAGGALQEARTGRESPGA